MVCSITPARYILDRLLAMNDWCHIINNVTQPGVNTTARNRTFCFLSSQARKEIAGVGYPSRASLVDVEGGWASVSCSVALDMSSISNIKLS